MSLTNHEISLHGMAGAVFWCSLTAVIFYVLGFATVDWLRDGPVSVGLWITCSRTDDRYQGADWYKATEAMITIGLIFLIVSFFVMFLYMFIHSMNLNKTIIIIIFTACAFTAVIFMLIGFIIFGVKKGQGHLHWSYAFSVIGGIFCFIAGILAVVQMKQSNVV